jgi:hypothetical protein
MDSQQASSKKFSSELEAAWQNHVLGVAEQLFGGWKRQVESLVSEHLKQHQARGNVLNQSLRRLRVSESHAEWTQTVLDSAVQWCAGAALFSTLSGHLKCESVRGLPASLTEIESPLDSAPAFKTCVETGDPVVALANPGELSPRIAAEIAGSRVHLFPLVSSGNVQAILLADGVADPGQLELLAGVAGATLEKRPAEDGWNALSKEERQLHLKAQRFATVRVSQIRIKRAAEVESGRAAGCVYTPLRREIDEARDEFREKFMDGSTTMVDYLHLELLRILANNDNAQFGPDYPGPLA